MFFHFSFERLRQGVSGTPQEHSPHLPHFEQRFFRGANAQRPKRAKCEDSVLDPAAADKAEELR
jgi:hypothetical protein